MKNFVEYISVLQKLSKEYDIQFVISEFGIKMTKTWGPVDDKDSFYKCNHILDLEYIAGFNIIEEFEDYIKFMNNNFNEKYQYYLEKQLKEK